MIRGRRYVSLYARRRRLVLLSTCAGILVVFTVVVELLEAFYR